jgi:hypothetical protein
MNWNIKSVGMSRVKLLPSELSKFPKYNLEDIFFLVTSVIQFYHQTSLRSANSI